ncbi:uncharacterized protein LOC124441663 [Xenia sp. Carnegie-2017]|uniref:uncharacterized protein LOC124441663 n=1 Tax=Xenia sp. Carnegie-2017 TaxID=2897299 RepID=UPI001F0493B0|nr:uncharacterized protein LOC124441663 [Xenia sp. Carnegie-2017]
MESGKCTAPYWTVGCYADRVYAKRALSELIFTDRDKYSIVYSGKEIDWENYGAYISDLACHCSKKTAEKDYSYFGLQFYGECWSGPHANETYAVYGDSNNCINEFYKDCELLYDEICIGRDNANFIYTILASPGSGSGDS